MSFRIRKSTPADALALFEVWRTAVARTHDFLSAQDSKEISRLVRDKYLPTADLDVAVDEDDIPLAFMGMTDNEIDSLFVHGNVRGTGIGRLLAELAFDRAATIRTEVNEQNSQAVDFWKHMGFQVVGRSDTDRQGKPYPLLIMERSSGSALSSSDQEPGEPMPDHTDVHEGSCACGHVRFRMESQPLIVHCCHCSWCQRQTGSAFAVNALIEADRVHLLQGDVADIEVPSPSGANQRISRCPKCQVAVWSYYLVMAGGIGELIRFIRVGTLDHPDRLPPDVHIYTSSKQPWVVLPPDALAVENYYVTKEVWPKESLERRAALLNAVQR